MKIRLNAEDKIRITKGIRQKYRRVASGPQGNFRYPTGSAGLNAQQYDQAVLEHLDEEIQSSYCGVGNPFLLGPISAGDAVLDVGCGTAVDTLVAALLSGENGKAVGVDLVPEMLDRARLNIQKSRIENIFIALASAEELPFADDSFDVIISNGAFNLVPDKPRALTESIRVLRPAGKFMIADQVLTEEIVGNKESILESWSR